MHYRLRDGLHYCVVSQNAIFLDVRRSRYFALPPIASSAFQRLAERGGHSLDGDEAALRGLISSGLLVLTDRAGSDLEPVRITSATADLLGASVPPFHFHHTAFAFFWEAKVALQLRIHSLSWVLVRACKRPPPTTCLGSEVSRQIPALSRAFDHTAYLLGRTNRCLVRSLALFTVLRNRGIAAQFVIGVRSHPFAAHAWVQYESTVLNDDAEQVRCYTPILALP